MQNPKSRRIISRSMWRLLVGAIFITAVAMLFNNCTGSFKAATNTASLNGASAPTPSNSTSSNSSSSSASTSSATTLSQEYPGDVGIQNDPSVVWSEHFDEGSIGAFVARYDTYDNEAGMSLVPDVPAGSAEKYAIQLTSNPTTGADATDFYKNFANFSSGYTDLYFRWYVKYQAGIPYHHTGVWFGGYNPPLNWPYPHAGQKPTGTDRFSIAIEPIWHVGTSNPVLDFYNYWMNMQSCSSCGGKYWGNELVENNSFTADTTWECIEVHLAINTDMNSAAGSMLEVWKNNNLVQSFSPTGPAGGWVQDHYCPAGSTASQCQYSYTLPGPADLQVRTTSALNINYFWPQNYITSGNGPGSVWYSNMVVATKRIGCLVP